MNYRGKVLTAHKLGSLVENCVVWESKSVDGLLRSLQRRSFAYVSAANLRLGLRINFDSRLLHRGLRRFILCGLSVCLRG